MEIKEFNRKQNEAKKLLKISKYDLKTSIILFRKKKYSWSVYAFQQSIEKCSKALHIIDGKGDLQTMKENIKHNIPKLYSQSSTDQLKKAKNLNLVLQKFPELRKTPLFKDLKLTDYQKGNKDLIKLLEKVKKEGIIFSDDKNELNNAIFRIKELIKESKNIDIKHIRKMTQLEFDKIIEDYYLSIGKAYELAGKDISNEIEEIKKIPLNIMKKVIEFQTKTIYLGTIINTINLVLTLLINPHFEFVRYPEKKNPLEYYTKKNPLIKRFSILLKLHNKNLKLHDKWINLPSILDDIEGQPI